MEQYKIKNIEKQARRIERAAEQRDEKLDDQVMKLQNILRDTQDRVSDLEIQVKRMRREHAKILRAMDALARRKP